MFIKIRNNKMKGFDYENIKLVFGRIPNIGDKNKVKINRVSKELFTFSLK